MPYSLIHNFKHYSDFSDMGDADRVQYDYFQHECSSVNEDYHLLISLKQSVLKFFHLIYVALYYRFICPFLLKIVLPFNMVGCFDRSQSHLS